MGCRHSNIWSATACVGRLKEDSVIRIIGIVIVAVILMTFAKLTVSFFWSSPFFFDPKNFFSKALLERPCSDIGKTKADGNPRAGYKQKIGLS